MLVLPFLLFLALDDSAPLPPPLPPPPLEGEADELPPPLLLAFTEGLMVVNVRKCRR